TGSADGATGHRRAGPPGRPLPPPPRGGRPGPNPAAGPRPRPLNAAAARATGDASGGPPPPPPPRRPPPPPPPRRPPPGGPAPPAPAHEALRAPQAGCGGRGVVEGPAVPGLADTAVRPEGKAGSGRGTHSRRDLCASGWPTGDDAGAATVPGVTTQNEPAAVG